MKRSEADDRKGNDMTGEAVRVGRWPFPGDSPVVRARRVALAYRAALLTADPVSCDTLDRRMRGWGQGWAVVRLYHYEMTDWITPAQAAELGSVNRRTVAAWRRHGRLRGRRGAGGWEYLAGDVLLALSGTTRGREATPDVQESRRCG